jgi:regulation of enolase protein 1 (concanavalin A-like superfamily)
MPFSNINSVSGGIDIQFTAMLNDLDGLHNLTSVGGLLFVENNNALTSIASLNSLNTIGQIIIRFNPLLTSILGFGSLATVNNNLSITDNPALAIISGFNALSTIDIIDITNNALLTSIPDFGSLTTVNNLLNINNNTALVTISGFNALNTVGNTLVIKNNAMLASISGFGSPGAAASNNVVGGAIQCFNNPSLMSITGFNNFTSTVNDVAIFDNQTLSTISGFSNLNSVNTLFIKGNPALVTPPGLDNISMVNNIEIRSNNALTSLSTLNNLSTISGNVTIVDNSNLAACNSTWLCNVINNTSINFNITNNATGCNSKAEVSNSCTPALMAICKNATVSLNANGQASIQVADVNNGSVGATMATVSPSTFNCSNLGANTVTLTVTDASGNTDQCTSTVTVSTGVGLPNSWQGGAVGVPQSPPPVLNFSACNGNTPTGQFTIGGSSNNATTSTTDNITFAYQTICGTNSSITVKVETVSSGGYGGLMIRESSMPGAKQVAVFSNLTNSLRHEVRYMNNGPKVVQNFMKPNPIWLRLKRMGTWVFAEYSFNGVTFQPVHAVNVPMQNCVQVGMAAFSFIPGQQATATFSNVTTTGTVVPIAIEEGPAQEDKRTGESLSLFEEQIENDVTLFPNPASTHINLQFERPTVATTRITILNPLGQVSSTSILPRGVEREVFDVQGYAPGMYVLRVENEELNEVIPFIISR